jgi:hypothetical protein
MPEPDFVLSRRWGTFSYVPVKSRVAGFASGAK